MTSWKISKILLSAFSGNVQSSIFGTRPVLVSLSGYCSLCNLWVHWSRLMVPVNSFSYITAHSPNQSKTLVHHTNPEETKEWTLRNVVAPWFLSFNATTKPKVPAVHGEYQSLSGRLPWHLLRTFLLPRRLWLHHSPFSRLTSINNMNSRFIPATGERSKKNTHVSINRLFKNLHMETFCWKY